MQFKTVFINPNIAAHAPQTNTSIGGNLVHVRHSPTGSRVPGRGNQAGSWGSKLDSQKAAARTRKNQHQAPAYPHIIYGEAMLDPGDGEMESRTKRRSSHPTAGQGASQAHRIRISEDSAVSGTALQSAAQEQESVLEQAHSPARPVKITVTFRDERAALRPDDFAVASSPCLADSLNLRGRQAIPGPPRLQPRPRPQASSSPASQRKLLPF